MYRLYKGSKFLDKLTKLDYEKLINNSCLFEIDKQESPALYETEKRKMYELITRYYINYVYIRDENNIEYGYTLITTINDCIKYYDKSKGDFVHLLNWAMKRNIAKEKARDKYGKMRGGINIPEKVATKIKKIVRLLESKCLDVSEPQVQQKIASLCNITVAKLQELMHINASTVVVSSTQCDSNGNECEIFDFIHSKDNLLEEKLIQNDSIADFIQKINDTFVSCQERQKPLLSMLLTKEIIKDLQNDYDLEKISDILKNTAFKNDFILKSYISTLELTQDKQIAEMCGVSPESLSRTFKNFKEKLKMRR